jgi:hypothetical protein
LSLKLILSNNLVHPSLGTALWRSAKAILRPSIPIPGQVERMNRTIKDAMVKRYFYDTHKQLKAHLTVFLKTHNFARDSRLTRPTNTSAKSGRNPG